MGERRTTRFDLPARRPRRPARRCARRTDLGVARIPAWAGAVRLLQWLLVLAAISGGVWLVALAVMGYLQVPEPDTPRWQGWPVPTLMLLGGVAAGILLALVCRLLVRLTARSRGRTARARLTGAISGVARELVIEPVEAELAAYRDLRAGLDRALK